MKWISAVDWLLTVDCWCPEESWVVAAVSLLSLLSQVGRDTNVGCLHKVGQLQQDSDTTQCQCPGETTGVRSWDRCPQQYWSRKLSIKVYSRSWDSVIIFYMLESRLQTCDQRPTWGQICCLGWEIMWSNYSSDGSNLLLNFCFVILDGTRTNIQDKLLTFN